MVGCAAPEQCTVIGDAEAIAALERHEQRLSIPVGEGALPGVGCPIINIDSQPAYWGAVRILHRYSYIRSGRRHRLLHVLDSLFAVAGCIVLILIGSQFLSIFAVGDALKLPGSVVGRLGNHTIGKCGGLHPAQQIIQVICHRRSSLGDRFQAMRQIEPVGNR